MPIGEVPAQTDSRCIFRPVGKKTAPAKAGAIICFQDGLSVTLCFHRYVIVPVFITWSLFPDPLPGDVLRPQGEHQGERTGLLYLFLYLLLVVGEPVT
jgi:hypothetical protein